MTIYSKETLRLNGLYHNARVLLKYKAYQNSKMKTLKRTTFAKFKTANKLDISLQNKFLKSFFKILRQI